MLCCFVRFHLMGNAFFSPCVVDFSEISFAFIFSGAYFVQGNQKQHSNSNSQLEEHLLFCPFEKCAHLRMFMLKMTFGFRSLSCIHCVYSVQCTHYKIFHTPHYFKLVHGSYGAVHVYRIYVCIRFKIHNPQCIGNRWKALAKVTIKSIRFLFQFFFFSCSFSVISHFSAIPCSFSAWSQA